MSFEGGEGCGKSTQIARLLEWLSDRGRATLSVREPGGTALGERIRELLQHAPEGAGMVPEAELLLFAASRAQLVRERIRPALERGSVVVADRFLDSTSVYQGVARGLDAEVVAQVNRIAVGDCLPDATILLDLPPRQGFERMRSDGRAADRIESETLDFFERVREGYLALAAAQPERILVVDASGSADEVTQRITAIWKERIDGMLD